MLEGVVVSSNRNETNRKEAPGIVNIISPKMFEKTNSVCVAQGLNFQPGVRTEINCQNCGLPQVRINGLDGTYSQILINRTNYAGAQQDPNGFGKTDGKTFVAGGQYTYSMDKLLFMPSVLTTGTEYNIDDLHDVIQGYNRTTDQHINITSAYLQNEWRNKKLSIHLGGRFDKHCLI